MIVQFRHVWEDSVVQNLELLCIIGIIASYLILLSFRQLSCTMSKFSVTPYCMRWVWSDMGVNSNCCAETLNHKAVILFFVFLRRFYGFFLVYFIFNVKYTIAFLKDRIHRLPIGPCIDCIYGIVQLNKCIVPVGKLCRKRINASQKKTKNCLSLTLNHLRECEHENRLFIFLLDRTHSHPPTLFFFF